MHTPRLSPPPLLLLRNAELFTPEPLGRQDLLLAGGQVVAIGTDLELPPSSWRAQVLDLQGARVVPGFIDAHVHLAGGGGEAGASTRVPPVQLTQLTLAGVTTVVGLLGTDGTTRTIAELLACARGLQELGLTAFCYTGSYQVPPVTLTGSVRGDLVHNDRLIAVGELAISDHRSSQPSFEEFVRIASDAHVAGMMTGKAGLLHLHLGDGVRGLDLVRRALDETELPARTFQPTHCNRNRRLWEEAKRLSTRGIPVDVTAFPAEDDAPSAAQALCEWWDAGLDPAGITVSSDGGGCLPVFDRDGVLIHMDVGRSLALVEAVVELLAQGRPLAQILPPFTSNVAKLLRLHGKGELRPGTDADLVVLDAEGRPDSVLAQGRWLVREGRPCLTGLFEAAGTVSTLSQ
jgi:beta-aspartyl-dipeptidase (metallo-type)